MSPLPQIISAIITLSSLDAMADHTTDHNDKTPRLNPQFDAELERRIRTTIETREKAIKLNYAFATKVGLTPSGEPLSGDDAAANLRLYGAECPRQRYTSMMPLISLKDLSKEWGISIHILRGWSTRESWDLRRQEWLATVPVEHGGTNASGDLERMKAFFVATMNNTIIESIQITREMLRENSEQVATKDGVVTLEKTGLSHKALVDSLKTLNEMGRVALGMPTKLSATYSQSSSTRHTVNETVIHAPDEKPEQAFNVEDDINPPPLPPMLGTLELNGGREFLAESYEESKSVTASYGEDASDEDE